MSGTDPTLTTEWSLLRVAGSSGNGEEKQESLRALLRAPICWKNLLDLAVHHGVQPLLYQSLSKVGESVPATEMRALAQGHQANLHKALFLSRELIGIVNQLSGSGIEVMPYKGVILAETLYGDIALRQAGDIDLFIRSADLPRIRESVHELGYVPHMFLSDAEEQAQLKSGYECAFDSAAGRNLLEVQWAIQPRFYAVDFDMDGLFRRGVIASVAGRPMKTPSAEDLFVVLSLHAAKHVWGRLIWLCDLGRLMQLRSLNWNWIGTQAKELRIVRILRVGMLLANRLLAAPIPAIADASLPQDFTAVELADEFQRRIASHETHSTESAAYFRLMLRLREGKADRLRFLSRLIFTPGPGEWKAIGLPRPLFPLYRMVRLSRLAARLVRN